MRLHRYGRFWAFNGNGVFVSFWIGVQLWTLALRPIRWHVGIRRPPYKPGYVRLYIGPIEIEKGWRLSKDDAAMSASREGA